MDNNIRGFWNVKKEKLKQHFDNLTENDVICIEGKEKEMIEQLAYKLGKTKEELVDIIVTL